MTTLSYTVPVAGTDLNSVADPEISTALNSILTWAGGNIDGTNVAATLTGRRLVFGQAITVGGSISGTQFANSAGDGVLSGGSGSNRAIAWAYLDPAGFAVTGKSNTRLVLRASLATNAGAP